MSGEARMTRKKTKHQQNNSVTESPGSSGDSTRIRVTRSSTKKMKNGGSRSRRSSSRQEGLGDNDSGCSDLVLWKSPLRVVHYSSCELALTILDWIRTLASHKITCALVGLLIGLVFIIQNVPGAHQSQMLLLESYLLWCGWWVGLGILSSVGLGTGLHTFLLYLGPHIAAVTMAAYECQSTDFPSPPYPDQIVCPEARVGITIWDILSKVRVEAFCWGAGTAIGELPPYFMARAARLSGSEPGDDVKDVLALQEKKQKHPDTMTTYERWESRVQLLVEKAGFVGILLCASIPNPLFDLAGITCGHFLVPFWTFFGATLIGKAVIKMHIQKVFVILAFNETLLESSILLLHRIPVVGAKLEAPIRSLLAQQKEKLHAKGAGGSPGPQGNILSSIFEKFVLAMVAYFVVSIVHSLAQAYHRRLAKRKD